MAETTHHGSGAIVAPEEKILRDMERHRDYAAFVNA